MTHPATLTAPLAPWAAYACLASSMALVGSYVGLSKLLVAVFPVMLLAWLRFAIAAVAMLHWVRAGPQDLPLNRCDKRWLFLESFLGNFLFSICMLYGVMLTSAVAAGVAMAAIPAMVALLSRLLLRELLRPRVLLAIACSMAAIAALALLRSKTESAAPAEAGLRTLLGYALLMGAVICEAAYVVIGKRLTGRVSPRRISALINLWGLLLITPFGLWQALHFDFGTVGTGDWGLLMFYALAASMVTVWLWMQGLKQVSSARAGVFTVMLPVSSAAVGVFWLGEPFTLGHGVALSLALLGLLLATWPERATPR